MRIEGQDLETTTKHSVCVTVEDDGIVVKAMPVVYLLRCADGSLYVGHTDDLASREQTHNDGHGATYTAARRPVRMIYAEEYPSIQNAITRERQLKRWTAEKKEALVVGSLSKLKVLSRRTDGVRGRITFTWQDLVERHSVKSRET